MTTVQSLIREVSDFCRDLDISESTFGNRVMRDTKFMDRLRGGGDVTTANLDRIRSYIAGGRKEAQARAERLLRRTKKAA